MDMAELRATLHARIESALFVPETGQFYDYLSEGELAHLPYPAEIAAGFPNPCGWGTGMEDAMLHAGSMIEVYCRQKDSLRAERVLAGVRRAVTVHGVPGFVARAVSPRDGRSCYANSSRDQFTLAVFGAWRCYRAGICADTAAEILGLIAEYCRRSISPENGYNLLRLDGLPGVVSKMRDVSSHEALRLPLIHAAAAASGGGNFSAEDYALFESALRQTLAMDPARNWWDIELVQQQLSLVVLLECGLFRRYEKDIRRAIRTTAEYSLPRFAALVATAENFTGDWCIANANWRKLPLRIEDCCLSPDGECVPYYGKHYLNPVYPAEYMQIFSLLRGMGNYLIALAYAADVKLDRELYARFIAALSKIAFAHVRTSGIIQLLHGLELASLRCTPGVSADITACLCGVYEGRHDTE